jgi:hypothetical protein
LAAGCRPDLLVYFAFDLLHEFGTAKRFAVAVRDADAVKHALR